MVLSELGGIRGLLWLNGPRIRQETDDQLVYPQNCLTARREGPLLSPKASSGRLDLWSFSVPLMSHSGRTLIFSLTPQKTENSGEDVLAYSSVTPQSGSALLVFMPSCRQSQTTVCGGGDRYNFHCLGSWFCYLVLQTHLIFNVFLAHDVGRGLGQNNLASVGFHPLET